MDGFQDQILYQDNQYLFLNKPPGIACLPDKTSDVSLFDLAQKKTNRKLFPLTRLDRPVSGITVFAKNRKAASSFWEAYEAELITKEYLALTENIFPENTGILKTYILRDGKNYKARVVKPETIGAKIATSKYLHLISLDRYHLYSILNVTGRFHQIRVQLSTAGAPIKGDVKYGARRKNKDRSIHLHCWRLKMKLTKGGSPYEFEAPLPEESLWNVVSEKLKGHPINKKK